jgi:hypothetical protein
VAATPTEHFLIGKLHRRVRQQLFGLAPMAFAKAVGLTREQNTLHILKPRLMAAELGISLRTQQSMLLM